MPSAGNGLPARITARSPGTTPSTGISSVAPVADDERARREAAAQALRSRPAFGGAERRPSRSAEGSRRATSVTRPARRSARTPRRSRPGTRASDPAPSPVRALSRRGRGTRECRSGRSARDVRAPHRRSGTGRRTSGAAARGRSVRCGESRGPPMARTRNPTGRMGWGVPSTREVVGDRLLGGDERETGRAAHQEGVLAGHARLGLAQAQRGAGRAPRARRAPRAAPARRPGRSACRSRSPGGPAASRVDVEAVGIGEAPLVAVGRAEQRHDVAPFGMRTPAISASRVAVRKTICTGASKRSVSSTSAGHQRGIGAHARELRRGGRAARSRRCRSGSWWSRCPPPAAASRTAPPRGR